MNTDSETWTISTDSPEATQELGRRLGELLQPGDVVALVGPLGAGKTVLVKGVAQGLGTDDPARRVHSPTFVLVSEYPGRLWLYHVDAYRLAGPEDLEAIGIGELLAGEGVTVVEWADRVSATLPPGALWVHLEHVDATTRRLTFRATADPGLRRLQALRSGADPGCPHPPTA